MFDTIIRGGTLVDGSGDPRFTGDIGIVGGRIAEVGGRLGAAHREIDAHGAIVTPGWVDVHTHYDGQVTWDPYLSPSTDHGVTSVVMGNCGVGFAPVHRDRREWLISVMEGVEDIPGTVLAEGIDWQWESFPEYLDALERMPRALDVGAQIPHSALRTYVMGERGITHDEATPADIQAMVQLVREGMRAGALGFSTSRTIIHKYQGRKYPPGTFASPDEILGIARVLGEVGHGVFQMTSNHYQMETELPWMTQLARENNLPVAFALVQTDQTPDTWKRLLAALDETHRQNVPLYGAVAGRPAGILMAWLGSTHPFMAHPLWQQIAPLPWDEKLARLRDPAVRAQLTDMDVLAGAARHDSRMAYLTQSFHKMYALGAEPDYEPPQERSVAAIAQREGRTPLEVVYDMLMDLDGKGIVYFPSFNYAYNDLSQLHAELQHPRTMMSLADGGAHCGYICDVSMPTYMLTHWARDRSRGPTLPLELMVQRQTRDTARIYGLEDRGLLRPGYLADINIIDFDRLRIPPPHVAFDLPAGGRRLVQTAEGYRATLKAGETIMENGERTGALPGKLMRGPQRRA
ncbi:amidohydrolase [Variovorax paradoxus]|jgi:N-acyl-D-aspartate/D-glutamate deacylase|uniref:N-acyl-D-amino-acid deacylase family protein n=1 Tax=Variovorax paradoxus TaxID=34073 RepID=UPI0006E56241|nr:amidohydrolase [Variovorax paradoxus]KPU92289.1 amidohydrolase [Variovorax paradoxus]KPV05709.1 amidohydrolase [Variovorax paradoxus]KPV15024.1 amidohydrolase [Variovorax paradoxus]KPV20227.1 amidohydrolase [Variovorax paradoxus]